MPELANKERYFVFFQHNHLIPFVGKYQRILVCKNALQEHVVVDLYKLKKYFYAAALSFSAFTRNFHGLISWIEVLLTLFVLCFLVWKCVLKVFVLGKTLN